MVEEDLSEDRGVESRSWKEIGKNIPDREDSVHQDQKHSVTIEGEVGSTRRPQGSRRFFYMILPRESE